MSDKQQNGLKKTDGVSRQVDTQVIPDICNSLNSTCQDYNDYCKNCNHAIFKHEIKVKNRIYKFEFNKVFGVIFLRKDDTQSKIFLSEKHPF